MKGEIAPMRGKMKSTRGLPKGFIGSSTESLDIAHAIQEELERDADMTIWHQGVVKLSNHILDDLTKRLDTTDFGIFLLLSDDEVSIRGQLSSTTRDNVLFELGLFIGRLGKERCFLIMAEDHRELHLPTDIQGITPATFNPDRIDKNLRAAIGPACNKIRTSIKNLGVFRSSYPKDDLSNLHKSGSFVQESNSVLADTPSYYSSPGDSRDVRDYLLCEGDIFFEAKDYSEALKAFEIAIYLDSNCATSHVKKGDVLQKLKLYDGALAAYKLAICRNFNLAPAFIGQGDTLTKLKRFSEAMTAYKRVICLDPKSAPAYTGTGYIYGVLGHFEDALAACEQAIRLDSIYASAYDRKAIILGALRRCEEALVAHEYAIHLSPFEATFHNNKGATLRAFGYNEESLMACERAIQLDPEEVMFFKNKNATLRNLEYQEKTLIAHKQTDQLNLTKDLKVPVLI